MEENSFALIAGGGPVGLTLAIDLGRRGVPAILVNEGAETARHPKCNNTNARSMEHFRRLGLAARIREKGLPPDYPKENAYVTRFCGYELGRIVRLFVEGSEAAMGNYRRLDSGAWQGPEPSHTLSQLLLEPILKEAAGRHADVRFGWRLESFDDDGDGVACSIASVVSGERRTVRVRYLVGCDGAHSPVRRRLGFGLRGEDGRVERSFMGGTLHSYFIRAPGLLAASGRRPAVNNWIINRRTRGFLYAQDGRELWIAHYQVPPGTDPASVDARKIVHELIGADVAFEILSGGPWTGGQALVAEHYQAGRVFLAGDAAHLYTPLGGMGMNTGIGDAVNLGWKLAAVHAGWAGHGLMDSYEAERRPIGERNSKLGVYCARKMSAWPVPENIEEPGEAADAARKAFGDFCMEDDREQYQTAGMQLGERYEGSPIVSGDGTPEPPDSWFTFTPVARAGARAPHFWLAEGRSLYDELGPDFTLLDFGGARAEALEAAARERGLPLKVLRLPPQAPYAEGLVLVRPDQHIAWCGHSPPADPDALVGRVCGAA